jgi:mannose-binding lectin 1
MYNVFIWFLLFVLIILAHEEHHDFDEPGHMSLPNLLHVNELQDIQLNWETFNDVKYDNGRLVFYNQGGSLWSIPQLANTGSEWTIEVVFRSSGTAAKDLQFSNDNGLSFWLVDPITTEPINAQNTFNFGGPSKFDGFQFLFNNKENNGLKIFNSDGSNVLPNSVEKSIGDCGFNYLDSQVPFTLRISYSKEKNWLKVQIDNNVCFKTDKITLPEDISDFKFGITTKSNPSSSEEFELFKLNVWNHLTEDAVDDHGLLADGELKVDVKTVVKEKPSVPSPDSIIRPGNIRESLMEKNRRFQEHLQGQTFNNHENGVDSSFGDITLKLESLVQAINSLEKSNSNELRTIESQVQDLKIIHAQQVEVLHGLQKSVDEFKSTITEQYSQMLEAVSKLSSKVIGEVREQQYSMEEIGKKVDLLMANHKEISYQYKQQGTALDQYSNQSGIANTLIKWILIPVVAVIIVLTVVVSRLRHDIKHSKLL